MRFLHVFLLQLVAAALVFAQAAPKNELSDHSEQPVKIVQSIYQEIVAHHPSDIPTSTDMKIFAPYLSEGLRHRIEDSGACLADWKTQRPGSDETEGFNTPEMLFAGINSSPISFNIEKTVPQKDGSLRVFVELTFKQPKYPPWSEQVAPVMIPENGQFFVDDIVYISPFFWPDPKDKPADRRLSGYLSAGCDGPHWGGPNLPSDPSALAQGLNKEVVARHPLGIPSGEDWKVFAPYIGSVLMHRIDDYDACMADQERRFGSPDLKPPGLIEYGIFSGGDEEASPRSFRVERAETQKDGSVRVVVRFRMGKPPDGPYFWRVADVFVKEDGRYLLKDVIFLKDKYIPEDIQLSKLLVEGCDGPRWIGYNYKK